MRVTVLRARKGSGPDALVAYYAGLARDQHERDGLARGPADYYVDPDEAPGRWWGKGCHSLGLDGDVEPDEVEALLLGRHPSSGEALGRRFREDGARAFDATFSAPKSVSVLWGLSDDPALRSAVLAAHDAAVDAALGWLEAHGALTRRGANGVDQVDAQGLTVARFRQHTSRAGDPQLHTHALVFAKVQDRTGRWLSLDARFLVRQQRTIGWIYDAALRAELAARLDVGFGVVFGGQAEVDSVPAEVCELFSARTAQVDQKLAELVRAWMDDHDGAEPDPRTLAALERRAVLASRPPKAHGLDPEDLHAHWRERLVERGFDPASLYREHGRERDLAWDRDAVIAEAIARVGEEGATWLRADLAREIATRLPPDAATSGPELVALIDELAEEAASRCVELHPLAPAAIPLRRDGRPVSEHVTDRRLSTERLLGQEARLYGWAREALAPSPAERLVDVSGLDPAQIDAARAVAGRARLALVVGPAGTGKTTCLAAAVETLAARDRVVVALAPTGKAADVLGERLGCPSATVAALLAAHRGPGLPPFEWRLPPGATVIVDEASMVGTDDLERLVSLVERHQWRLALVGDPHQLPAVGRAGMFSDLTERFAAVHMREIHRFDAPWEAEASLGLRAGEPGAVDAYLAHGRIHSAHPAVVAERVARWHETLSAQGHDVAVTTASVETARAINLAIQRRRHRGVDGSSVRLHDDTLAFVGDRVATRRNHRRFLTTTGAPVRNRQQWTLVALSPDSSVTLSHPIRGEVVLPPAYVARHLELGWAVTGYGTQGVTVDHALCVVEPGTSRAGLYVGMTRGRAANLALVVDPTGVDDPADTLARVIERPPTSLTAHAMRRRLYEQQGMEVADRDLQPNYELMHRLERAREQLRRLEHDLSSRERRGPGLDIA